MVEIIMKENNCEKRSVRMTGESNVKNMYGRPDKCEADPNYTLRPTLVDHPQERHDDDNS